jgi:hypothetical protein
MLPDWNDNARMEEWLNVRLDEINRVSRSSSVPLAGWAEIKAAEGEGYFGDGFHVPRGQRSVEPLRRKFPLLAPYLQLQGGRPKKNKQLGPIDFAAQDVDRIRSLWRQHYKRVNRKADEWSAEFFAARRWAETFPGDTEEEVTDRISALVEAIEAKRKPSGPKKSRAK